MQDRQTELTYHPRDLLSLDGVERVLCVAPHPDDEVFGCGGLLAALAQRGCVVHVVILTCGQQGAADRPDGDAAALGATRREESLRAAAELGIPPPVFLGLQDRSVRHDAALVEALSQCISLHNPQLLLLPSLSEPHPDHQATALAGLAAAQQAPGALHTVLFYECGAPLHANVHFPFDDVAERKWTAVRCFTSQLGLEDYEPHLRALARLRAFGLRPACTQAESFFRVNLQAVRQQGALAALPQWPWVRERLGLANDPAQRPLVSVLIRSMNRDCLPEALASVALQTYTHLEVVVVNASGGAHRPLDFLPASLPWRIVQAAPESGAGAVGSPEPAVPCGRARAANLALSAARGRYALFLDDDDLLQPQHLERLVQALHEHPQTAGAYAGVRVETLDGQHLRDYDMPWSRARLQGVNFLPIHAVLFRLDPVRQRALRFDEALPVLEDWDFWLQLTEQADLVHCPGVSAIYRQGLGQSAVGDAQHPHHWRVWHRRLLLQRVQALGFEALADTLAWHAVELDRVQSDDTRHTAEHHAAVFQLQQAQAALVEARELAAQSEAARLTVQHQLEAFGRETQAALAAKESALQLVAAQAAQQAAEREVQAQQFAAQSQAALAAKELALQALAAESAQQLAQRELQAQAFAAQAGADLDALQARLQALASEHLLQLQSKEAELQQFAQQSRQALDAKEAELQRQAAEAASTLAARQAAFQQEAERLAQRVADLQTQVAQSQADLRSVYASRSWRWTAWLRRGASPGPR